MKLRDIGVMALFCALAGTAIAHDEAPPEESGPWSGNLALGYLASQGNTDSSSGTFEFRVGYDQNAWHHALAGRAFGSSEEGDTTAENYKLGWKSSYDFTEFNYGFGALDWNKNRFSGFPRQSFATAGYGRRVLHSEKLVLNLEVGAGYSKQQKAVAPGVEEDENGAAGTLGGDFTWNFSASGSFEQTLYMYAASANTFWESVSRVRADLVGSLALGLSYTIQANSDVAPGIEKTDRFTAITLDYSF
jgi:putative salt-induced outer membrane protein